MRFLHAMILATALLLGQMFICRGIYVQADGAICTTCTFSSSVQTNTGTGPQQVTAAKDCTTCCTLAACSHADVKVSAVAPSAVDFLAAPASLPSFAPRAVVLAAVSAHAETFFPNAPPDCRSDRAPPFHLM